MMRAMSFRAVLAVACGAMAASVGLAAMAQTSSQHTGKPASAGVYGKAQADRGAQLYTDNCARCHGTSMEGLDVAPSLTGARFLGNWTGQPVAGISTRIRTSMPLDNPGALGLGASADITAAILAANGYPAGDADLPSSVSAQQAMILDAPPAK
jgi:quinoprotein glucose dehydrogenase